VTLLEAPTLARLERLQISTNRRLAGHIAGEHRSPRFGSSLDFADYRDYHPGDDFRRIDYHLLARLDVILLKLFEAEEDLQVRLLVDTSASMETGAKLAQAARVAAAIGFVALLRRDPVSLHTFPLDRLAPRFLGRNAVPSLFAALEALRPEGTTDFAAASARLLSTPGPRGLTVLLSDLLSPDWEDAISRLPSRGGDLVVMHVLAPQDVRPATDGDVELVDVERGSRVAVSLTAQTAGAYTEIVTEWRERVAQRCRRAGAGYVYLLSDEDVETLLLGAWRRAGVLR
jgi:uncharacterized protein (DUF58 family)